GITSANEPLTYRRRHTGLAGRVPATTLGRWDRRRGCTTASSWVAGTRLAMTDQRRCATGSGKGSGGWYKLRIFRRGATPSAATVSCQPGLPPAYCAPVPPRLLH